MIDLLPPRLKEHKHYASLNRRVIQLLKYVVVLIILVAGIFGTSWYFLNLRLVEAQKSYDTAVSQSKKYSSIEQDAKALAERLSGIEEVQGQQTHYTNLLKELSTITPQGVYIFSFQVSSEASPTMRLSAYATTSEAAAAFQQSIEKSSRFNSAALLGIDSDKDPYSGQPTNRVSYLVSLKPGALQ
ncbi:MAG: PilN domain-containing protein [bacterium]